MSDGTSKKMRSGRSSESPAAGGGIGKDAAGAADGPTVSNVVAKMFMCCLFALLFQTMVALFPSFVVNKVSMENRGEGGEGAGHHLGAADLPPGLSRPAVVYQLPTVCAHRGVNDANKTLNSTASALLSLCMQHDLCCGDYDVSGTNDGVLVVGTPSDLKILFPTAGRAGEGGSDPQVRDYTWKDIQEKDASGQYFTELRTIVDVAVALKGSGKNLLLTLEPKASTERLRRTLVERFTPLLSGRHSDMFAVIARNRKEVPPKLRLLAEHYVANHSLWVNTTTNGTRIATSVTPAPTTLPPAPTGAGGALGGEDHEDAAEPRGAGGGNNDRGGGAGADGGFLHTVRPPPPPIFEKDETIHFAIALRDRDLDEILSTLRSIRSAMAVKREAAANGGTDRRNRDQSPFRYLRRANLTTDEHSVATLSQLQRMERSQMVKAMGQCSLLCPSRGPKWARYIMPSNRFVKICSQLRHTAITDFGLDFYKKYFGRCLKHRGAHHAKHILWVLDKQADFSILPPKYHPAYVVSNKPVEVRDLLKSGGIVL